MPRLRYDAGWTRWAPALVLAVSGIALLPYRTQAQDRKVPPSEAAPKIAQDKRTLQLGAYTIRLIEAERNPGFLGGGQLGARPFRPNASFSLDISAAKPDDMLLIQGIDNLHAVDDKGRAAHGPEQFPIFTMMAPFGVEGVKRTTFPLQTEDGATALKTLEGNLILESGDVGIVTFAGNDLHFDSSKKLKQVTLALDFFKQYSDNEFRVFLTCEYPHITQPFDPQAPRHLMPMNQGRVTVEMIGTDGVTYKSSGRGELTHESRPQVPQTGVPVVGTVISHMDFAFTRVPEGVHVKSIVCRVVDPQENARIVPFKFTDIPLPGKP